MYKNGDVSYDVICRPKCTGINDRRHKDTLYMLPHPNEPVFQIHKNVKLFTTG